MCKCKEIIEWFLCTIHTRWPQVKWNINEYDANLQFPHSVRNFTMHLWSWPIFFSLFFPSGNIHSHITKQRSTHHRNWYTLRAAGTLHFLVYFGEKKIWHSNTLHISYQHTGYLFILGHQRIIKPCKSTPKVYILTKAKWAQKAKIYVFCTKKALAWSKVHCQLLCRL